MKLYIVFIAIITISFRSTLVVAADTPCFPYKDHPLYNSRIKPVLVSCWSILRSKKKPVATYNVNHRDHVFAPVSDLSSKIYDGLDWFWAANGKDKHDKFIKLHLTRTARVYIIVPVHSARSVDTPKLPGWTSLGRAKLVKGRGKPFKYGVHQTRVVLRSMYQEVYVFYKTGQDVVLPHRLWIQNNIKVGRFRVALPNGYRYFTMVAEKDGSKPEYPRTPSSVKEEIRPQQTCPESLHAKWVAKNSDFNDFDTINKYWPTSHPMWDPIWWCAYDHDHGSQPKQLMGYEPKYGYAAWKNGREDESNEGFKNVVIRNGKYNVLIMFHAQTSSLRRVDETRHTILFVVTDAKTNRIQAEITHKGYFGFLGVRKAGKPGFFMALTEKDRKIEKETFKSPRHRSINVLNKNKLDKRFLYRHPKHTLMLGVYEDWTTGPICAPSNRQGILRMDITKSATGIPTMARKKEKVLLGEFESGVFYRSTGVARLMLANNFLVGRDYCYEKFDKLPRRSGYFYTNAWGTKLMSGPGRDAIRQYVRPGFSMRLNGEFKALDSWLGLYDTGVYNEMEDHGYGLNPDKN